MRASRLIVAVLALALLGLVPATSSASAAIPTSAVSVPRAATSLPARAARVKKLTAKIVTRNGDQLFITGIIRPKKGPVVIQKATNCDRAKGTCNFTKFRKSKINKLGRYSTRVYAPSTGSWAWRAKKAKRTSEVWLTCIKRPGEKCPIP